MSILAAALFATLTTTSAATPAGHVSRADLAAIGEMSHAELDDEIADTEDALEKAEAQHEMWDTRMKIGLVIGVVGLFVAIIPGILGGAFALYAHFQKEDAAERVAEEEAYLAALEDAREGEATAGRSAKKRSRRSRVAKRTRKPRRDEGTRPEDAARADRDEDSTDEVDADDEDDGDDGYDGYDGYDRRGDGRTWDERGDDDEAEVSSHRSRRSRARRARRI